MTIAHNIPHSSAELSCQHTSAFSFIPCWPVSKQLLTILAVLAKAYVMGIDVECACAGPVVNLCLGGFVAAIRITSLLSMGMLRNTFVTSVCRFTMLHAPQSMQIKNAHAFRALLIVADENGNHMHVGATNLNCHYLGFGISACSPCSMATDCPYIHPLSICGCPTTCVCSLRDMFTPSAISCDEFCRMCGVRCFAVCPDGSCCSSCTLAAPLMLYSSPHPQLSLPPVTLS